MLADLGLFDHAGVISEALQLSMETGSRSGGTKPSHGLNRETMASAAQESDKTRSEELSHGKSWLICLLYVAVIRLC